MAAFRTKAIHLLKNRGNGYDTKGSVTMTFLHSATNSQIGTHTQTHSQIQSHTLSLTHLHTLPQTLPLTNTNFNAISQ
jgi:hypothetical protein